ncbi:hypothetical protein SAMN02745116_02633 [Pilibacter termitis]|uniref:Phage protein, HK97 gp10 family n=1 Tax=Pilibacter termitis TaxID=263852 RepID=A0A1T4RKT7_9ENTE|nr:hypothetical protein [Pilibacter termitis]SKA16620.1 hypothetical protein SAMN02745116_02633 [Pilibacter termitis]
MVEIKITNLEQALGKIDAIPEKLTVGLTKATDSLLDLVDENVVQNLGSVRYGNGEINRQNHREIKCVKGMVKGRFWNDSEIGVYREFGTGPVGEENHSDISPDVFPTYTQDRWFIPVNDVDIDLQSVYGIPKIKIQGEEFFMTRGQPARPWMYPAGKKAEEQSEKIITQEVNKALKELE